MAKALGAEHVDAYLASLEDDAIAGDMASGRTCVVARVAGFLTPDASYLGCGFRGATAGLVHFDLTEDVTCYIGRLIDAIERQNTYVVRKEQALALRPWADDDAVE